MTNTNAEDSDYIYENDKGSTASKTHDYYVNVNDYVLPPQDRNHALEIRPRKAEKGNEDDIYDNDTLANDPRFGKDFVNPPSRPNDKPAQRKLKKCTRIVIICLIIVAMLGFGGGLAYVLIDRIGKVLYVL